MNLVINKCVTAVKVSNFSGHYLRNRSTLDIGVLGYIGIVQHKELSPELLSIPPGTPCMYIVTNTTVFFVVCLLLLRFRPSMLAIFRLYTRNLSISYTNVCREFTVCGVGVRLLFVLENQICNV